MVSLKELWFSENEYEEPNRFEGSLPLSFGKLANLVELYIAVPTLTGPLPDLSGLTSLKECEFMPSGMCRPFGWNEPEGSTCDFSVFPECHYEISSDCQIIHEWLPNLLEDADCCKDSHVECRLDRIISLKLSSIEITSIPFSLSKVSELEILDLSNSGISGNMPFVSTILVSLRVLNLGSNSLSGPISLDIGNLINLRVLNLENNALSGKVPESLKELVLLEELYLANNDGLSGTISYLPLLMAIDVDAGITVEKAPVVTQVNVSSLDESKEGGGSFILPLIISLIVVLIIVIALTTAYFFLKSRRKQKAYEAGSSFTPSEARDIEMSSIDDASSMIIEPISETAEEQSIVGKVFGTGGDQLKIISLLSSGGFGDVWLAKFKGKKVAVKTLKGSPSVKEKSKLVRMLVHEADIMAQQKHARIVLFIGFRVAPLSLVMEYLPLGTLGTLIKSRKEIKKWGLRYQMMLDISEGMKFLHASINPLDGKPKMECFHQDLKTVNVLLENVNGSLRAKIADFGLSCIYRSLSLTHSSNPRHHDFRKQYKQCITSRRNSSLSRTRNMQEEG
jgi:hypothetical protein